MDVISFSLLLLIFILLIKKFYKYNHLIILIPIIYLVLILYSTIIANFFPLNMIVGKPDQYLYFNFALNYTKEHISTTNVFDIFINSANDKDWMHPLYWGISTFYYHTSLFDWIIGLRILNFLSHLIIGYYAYLTLMLLTENKIKSFIGMMIIFITPTFLIFDIYIIRDTLIIASSSVAFYYVIKFYYIKFSFLEYIYFFFLLCFIFLLRQQLSITFLLMIIMISLLNIFNLNRIKVILFYSVIMLILIYFTIIFLSLSGGIFSIVKEILTAFINLDFIIEYSKKYIIYFFGLGFLDFEKVTMSNIIPIIVSRLSAFDSILIPGLFFYFIVKGYLKEYRILIFIILFTYSLYFSVYMVADIIWNRFGFSFRALLPFFYIFYIFVLTNIHKLNFKFFNIKINSKGLK